MSLAQRLRPADGDPEGALVLFHGRGTDENDLFPLLDELDPERRLLGATARAPLALPPGGWHWYVIRQVGFPDPETFHATYELAGGWLDDLLAEHGIALDRTVLGGFSQGAVMAHSLGEGAARPAAGRRDRPERIHPPGRGLRAGRRRAACRWRSATASTTRSSPSTSGATRATGSRPPAPT